MDCEKAKNLIVAEICGDIDCNSEQWRELEAHLSTCQACAVRYQSYKQTVVFIKQHEAVFAEVLRSPEEKRVTEQEVIERSWKSIEAKLDGLEALEREEKQVEFRQFIFRVSSITACLIIGVSILFVLFIYSKPQIGQDSSTDKFVLAPKPSVKVELFLKNNRVLIPADQQIVSANELKTLVINDKHRMMMKTNTILAVEPLVKNGHIGCLVKLASGQIYAHVEHDGNPFLVATAHGKAVITGTTFDMQATDIATTLVVIEGTVQFESEKGVVEVAGGRKSRILGRSAPTSPVLCNAAKLTAWATGYEVEPALAQAESNWDAFDLPLPTNVEPIVLEKIDYDRWVEEKRDWFKQQFPHIFQLQNALAKEDIEVDYPELLIKTGDVWQFAYVRNLPDRFSILNSDSLLRAATAYGFEKQWLLENVTGVKYAIEAPVLPKACVVRLEAFEQWKNSLEDAQKSPKELNYNTLGNLFHASVYLAETRSLIWFAVRDGKYNLTDKKRNEILALLQEEVKMACMCQDDAFYHGYEQRKLSCDKEEKEGLINNIIENVEAIMRIEEKIAGYEISK